MDPHRWVGEKELRTREPHFLPDEACGAYEYSDCVMDDARLVMENLVDAAALGASIHNYQAFQGVERAGDGAMEVTVLDRLTGREKRPSRAQGRPGPGPLDGSGGQVGLSRNRAAGQAVPGDPSHRGRASVPILFHPAGASRPGWRRQQAVLLHRPLEGQAPHRHHGNRSGSLSSRTRRAQGSGSGGTAGSGAVSIFRPGSPISSAPSRDCAPWRAAPRVPPSP